MKAKFILNLLLLTAATTATAHDIVVDGIYYNINGNELTVTYSGSNYSSNSNRYKGDVVIPETVTYDGKTYTVTAIGNNAFYYCSVKTVSIPNSVTTIGSSAFFGCHQLKEVEIPNAVSYIPDQAFTYCHSLTSLFIPSSVTYIGSRAFECCNGLTSITVDGDNKKYDSRDNCNAIINTRTNALIVGCMNTVIPNTVTTIANNAFDSCDGLKSVTIPKSVTSIGVEAFDDCSGLMSITVESGNPKFDSRDDCNAIIQTSGNALIAGCANTVIPNTVTAIWYKAFCGRKDLKKITIPNSVTSIGMSAFYGCSGLTDLTISNSIKSIEWGVFYGCSSLKSVTIPNSVKSIGEAAFMHCTSLSSVAIPNSVTSIGENAFMYCNMSSVVIPSSVKSIGLRAFDGCVALKDVYSYIADLSNVSIATPVWPGNSSNLTLHVPQGTANGYQADVRWNPYFSAIIEMPHGDVDGDGEVGIADVVNLIDKILEEATVSYYPYADVNGDGSISITDLTDLIDLILHHDK